MEYLAYGVSQQMIVEHAVIIVGIAQLQNESFQSHTLSIVDARGTRYSTHSKFTHLRIGLMRFARFTFHFKRSIWFCGCSLQVTQLA